MIDKAIRDLMNKGNTKERQIARRLARGGRHPVIQKALAAAKAARRSITKDGGGGGAGGGAAAPSGTGFSSGGAPMTGSQVYTPVAGGTRTRKQNKTQTTRPRDSEPIGGNGGMG